MVAACVGKAARVGDGTVQVDQPDLAARAVQRHLDMPRRAVRLRDDRGCAHAHAELSESVLEARAWRVVCSLHGRAHEPRSRQPACGGKMSCGHSRIRTWTLRK